MGGVAEIFQLGAGELDILAGGEFFVDAGGADFVADGELLGLTGLIGPGFVPDREGWDRRECGRSWTRR